MIFSEVDLLADENINPEVVQWLTAQQHSVVGVVELGFARHADSRLLSWATEQNKCVLTHDQDFGSLVFHRQQPFYGIIYLRPGHVNPQFTISTLKAIHLAKLNFQPPFILVAENQGSRVKLRLRNEIGLV